MVQLKRIAAVLLLLLSCPGPFSDAISLPRPQFLSTTDPPPRDPVPPWFAPDKQTWWQRPWAWWKQWNSSPEPLEHVIVTPLRQDGSRASPASLWLPKSQLRREQGLQRDSTDLNTPLDPHNEPITVDRRSRKAPWYSYNSSDAAPLVPTSLSWMVDAGEMQYRAFNGSLDIDVARSLSELVAVSYCNASNLPFWNCTRCQPGFTPRRVIFDPLWDLQGFVGWSDTLNAVVIAFRGTDSHSYYNWVENMRTWRTDLALSYDGIPPKALVHGGFFYSYNSSYLAANITEAVAEIVLERMEHPNGAEGGGQGGSWLAALQHRRKLHFGNTTDDDDSNPFKKQYAPTVFVTGHSLGGALATLCALDIRITLGLPDVRVVSFGSPRVGNYIFAKWFEQEIGPHWRFTHNRDIVPSVPPGYMGFYHVSQEVWVVDVLSGRTLVGVCDQSGEDPRCHNSVCHLGLCSSVADHLLYLSEMYSPHPHGC